MPVDLTADCLAQWKMNDNTANTVVIDYSGNGHNGTFTDATGNPFTNQHDAVGKINGALDFDGADDFIVVHGMTETYSAISVFGWINLDDKTSNHQIVNSFTRFQLRFNSTSRFRVVFYDNESGWQPRDGTTDPDTGVWYLVGFT